MHVHACCSHHVSHAVCTQHIDMFRYWQLDIKCACVGDMKNMHEHRCLTVGTWVNCETETARFTIQRPRGTAPGTSVESSVALGQEERAKGGSRKRKRTQARKQHHKGAALPWPSRRCHRGGCRHMSFAGAEPPTRDKGAVTPPPSNASPVQQQQQQQK
jgi:hypothetical protein